MLDLDKRSIIIIIQFETADGIIEEIYPNYFTTKEKALKHLELINANTIVEPAPWISNLYLIHPNAMKGVRYYARLINLTMES